MQSPSRQPPLASTPLPKSWDSALTPIALLPGTFVRVSTLMIGYFFDAKNIQLGFFRK
jgi:hypothetical protein